VLLLATWTHQAYLLKHDYVLEASGLPWIAALLFFLGCWQVMMVAMMVPASLPTVFRLQQRPGTLVAFLAGYLAIWTAFALLAFAGDTLLHQVVKEWSWLSHHVSLIGAVTLALAGGFELTPFKAQALSRCGSVGARASGASENAETQFPQAPETRERATGEREWPRPARASGSGEAAAAGAVGVPGEAFCVDRKPGWSGGCVYGRWCVSACWALMLVLFGIGTGSVLVMAALTGLLALEKQSVGRQWVRCGTGGILLLLAAGWLVAPTWVLHTIGG
jgi:predicted metal-binding membrane protein